MYWCWGGELLLQRRPLYWAWSLSTCSHWQPNNPVQVMLYTLETRFTLQWRQDVDLQWSRTDLSEGKASKAFSNHWSGRRSSPGSPWLRVRSGASVNLIKKGIVKSSSDSGCEIMLLNPNNFYSNQLSHHEELRSKVEGGRRTSWHTFVNPKSCCRQNWKSSHLKNNYVSI